MHHLASSAAHSCAIRAAGLYCWGANAHGELGDGTKSDSDSAVHADAAGDDVVEVGAQSGRTCVRRSSGEVACWGANQYGQIGDGTREDALTAVPAIGIDDALQMAVDDDSTCVVRGSERRVSCWGHSPVDSPDEGSVVPMPIDGVSGVQQLSVGAFASYCALVADGSVLCWRFQDDHWSAPIPTALHDMRAISMPQADLVCAIPPAGNIVCQGIGGTFADMSVELPSSHDAQSLEAGSGGIAVCAPDETKAWQCWNVLSFFLVQMGQSDVGGAFPFAIESNMPLRELAIAGFRLCALREDRSVGCLDLADAANASMLLTDMHLELNGSVVGLPD
jgi:hypothetical protein